MEDLNFDDCMRGAFNSAEKGSKLTSITLSRESFAANATSTGSLCIDASLGGGIPPSRVVGIHGPERAGKSLLVTQIAQNQLEEADYVVLLDAEGTSDPLFMRARGIDFDLFRGKRNKKGDLKSGEKDLIKIYQPSTIEEVTNFVQKLSLKIPEDRSPRKPKIIYILDSVVALIPEANLEDPSSNAMAMHARGYSKAMPIISTCMIRTGSSFIYTNQLRQRPGVAFGSPDYEPCGDTIKFFSAMRLKLSQNQPKMRNGKEHLLFTSDVVPNSSKKQGGVWIEPHYDAQGKAVGVDRYVHTCIRTVKNKCFQPEKVCWMRIQFEENGSTGKGLDPVFDIFTFLYDYGHIGHVRKTEKTMYKNLFEPVTVTYVSEDDKEIPFDTKKAFGMPDQFDYPTFKQWINSLDAKALTQKIRQDLIVSGLIFS